MEQRKFFDHYKISTSATDTPEEIGRSGAAIVYKGTDVRSKEPVALQLIPVASLDPVTLEQFEQRARSAKQLDHINIARVLEVGIESDFLVLVSELVEGETTEAWVVTNGPMPLEAVLHVALQVVRALEAAAFFSLAHRALQPSNITMVPGTGPDGGWPFVKLLNFGLASAESHSSDTPGAALAPSMSPQFASPEQLRGQPIDFASEVYSLGKTICFLLTGAARLAGGATARHRRLPGLPRIPRRLRNLLRAMLSEEPPSRPQDPVALEQELLGCLTNIEKRTSIRRKLGIPAFAAWPKWATSSTPAAQILRGAIAFAVLILVGAGVMAAFFPRVLHFNRSANEIGVPIGVSQAATAQNSPAPAQSAVANPPPPVVASNQSTPPVAPSVAPTQSPLEVASANSANQTQPPAEGPKENSVSPQDESNQAVASTNSTPNESDAHASAQGDTDSEQSTASRSRSKARATESTTGTSHRSRYATDGSNENAPRYSHRGSFRAQQIGQTPDGRPILRLPSGRVIIATRGEPIPDYQAPRPRRLIRQPDVDDDGRAPWQPFNQPQD